jgi:DNA-binding NarL/FixJ family response regulator
MPLMNGLEETRILKKLMPAVPIIIYTTHGGRIVEKDGLEAGASAVISKSDDLAVLIGKARELLDRIAA